MVTHYPGLSVSDRYTFRKTDCLTKVYHVDTTQVGTVVDKQEGAANQLCVCVQVWCVCKCGVCASVCVCKCVAHDVSKY